MRWVVALVATVVATAIALPIETMAQERPWSLQDLFQPRERTERPARPGKPPEPAKRNTAKAPAAKKPATRRKPEPEIAVVAKAADASVVLVAGDFIAGAAAEGLQAIFAADPQVRIVDRSSGASGLVRDDHFDWPGGIAAIIAAEKPAAVVIALGANDRQSMRVGAARAALRSESWTREYAARVASLASEIHAAGVPLVWLGTPSFKSARMNADILAFNEIYRKVATDAGVDFIDVWEGFVDEKGAFVSTGPDVSGQPVRLRADDGINLTAAGERKLAFYAEKAIRRLLVAPGTILPGPREDGGSPSTMPAPAAADRTPPMALDNPALDGGDTLLGATAAATAVSAVRSAAPAGTPGRADDFSWAPLQADATPEPAPGDSGTASALRGPIATPPPAD